MRLNVYEYVNRYILAMCRYASDTCSMKTTLLAVLVNKVHVYIT